MIAAELRKRGMLGAGMDMEIPSVLVRGNEILFNINAPTPQSNIEVYYTANYLHIEEWKCGVYLLSDVYRYICGGITSNGVRFGIYHTSDNSPVSRKAILSRLTGKYVYYAKYTATETIGKRGDEIANASAINGGALDEIKQVIFFYNWYYLFYACDVYIDDVLVFNARPYMIGGKRGIYDYISNTFVIA